MKDDLAKGFIGTASPIIGVITSFQEQLEFYLRIAGLVLGLAVAAATFASIVRNWKRK